MKEELKKLYEYADLENTELGEYWGSLGELYESDFASPRLQAELEHEIRQQLRWVEENAKVVHETMRPAYPLQTYKRLVWNDEE